MAERSPSFWRRFVQRVQSMWQDEAASGRGERRFWVRYPSNVETWCRPHGAPRDRRSPARVVNISMGGMSLLVRQQFATGDMLSVEVPSAAASPGEVVLCVLHVAPRSGGEWCIGCALIGELHDTEMEALGAEWRRPSPDDLRHWVRYPSDAKAAIEIVGDGDSGLRAAEVSDICPTGLGLRVGTPLDVGTVLLIELLPGDGKAPCTKPACVVRVVRQEDGRWLLGCFFIRTLNKAEFRAFR